MTLYQKTREVVNDSINSAIFIDEKAKEFYSGKPNYSVLEEKLSKNLYSKFKKKGVSLAIHKFKQTDLTNQDTLKYLLKDRDLVLLDWDLATHDGEKYSLELLSKIVLQKQIHFCCIYTSESNHDKIIDKINTYFSGYDAQYYSNIQAAIKDYRDADVALFERISLSNPDLNQRMFNEFRDLDSDLPGKIIEVTGLRLGEGLIQVALAFLGHHKSPVTNPVPSHVSKENHSLNIKNTIITIIHKSENSASKILNKLSSQLWKSDNCFPQILGLDMQNRFNSETSFIDENLLGTTLDTLLYHRKKLIETGSEVNFESFITDVLQEQSKLILLDSKFKVLDTTFLDKISKNKYKVSDNELALLNTFYNGAFIDNKEALNFGDIFFSEETQMYYLCITALCDCLHPENIKNNFFFVAGKKSSDLDAALKTGDGKFKSYINEKTCIKWTMPVDDWDKGDYIKPVQLHIPDTNIVNNQLEMQYIKDSCHLSGNLEYVFTLKQQYAQRLANHSFAHPIRVGVDFVKK